MSPRVCIQALLVVAATSFATTTLAYSASNRVKSVVVNQNGENTTVVVQTSAPPKFHAQLVSGQTRLIVDISNAVVQGNIPAVNDPKGVVGGVVVQPYSTSAGKTTRLFIQLRQKAAYRVYVRGTQLVVELQPDQKTRPVPLKPINTAVTDKANTTNTANTSLTTHNPSAANVQNVSFEHAERTATVVIELNTNTRNVSYTESSPRPGLSRLVIRNAAVTKQIERTLDVTAFSSPVRAISTFSSRSNPNEVIVEVERTPRAIGTVESAQNSTMGQAKSLANTLRWVFAMPGDMPSSQTGIGADGGVARKSRTVAREAPFENVPVVRSGGGVPMDDDSDYVEQTGEQAQAGAFLPQTTLGQTAGRAYRGRRIDLDLKDADVHNVLRLLADVGRVNIIAADNVSGSVTIRMRNVPWDRALDVVLQAKGLGMIQEGNVIRVAPLAELEKEREMAIARRKQEYELTPIETRLIPVSYATASDVQNRAKDMLSPRGSLAVDERTNMLIARDVPGNLNQVEELVRSLDTQTPQVLVEARIVEATSRYLRDIGVQWGGDATFSSATGNPTGLVFPSSIGVVGGASDGQTPTAGLSPTSTQVQNPNFAVNLPATVGTGQGGAVGLTFGHINNTFNLALRLSAAETSGMVRIISSPRILTLDNHEANISQGTMIPFSQVSAMGVQTTFREAKLQLRVRPHVTADGSVAMRVKVNRDEPDFTQTSTRGDPTILKREAETELLVMDGHTAVIGGIFTRNTGRNFDQVPFFGDIPLLGLLFQRRRASDSRSELVIFITPRIVNRSEALGR